MLKISIVTISYNQAQFLERTILSVVNQNYENLEYIVVDAGSTDGSRDIIAKYRAQIDHVILEPDHGPADGLNKGFAIATGEILGFLNSDDMLLPNALTTVAACFDSKTDIVLGHGFIIDEYDHRVRRQYSDRFSLISHAYGSSNIVQQSTFFRAAIFRKVGGFNIHNPVAWDGELFVDMAIAGARFTLVNKFLGAFRIYNDCITGSQKMQTEYWQYTKLIFKKIMGREQNIFDQPLFLVFRILKHIKNPQALYERLAKGSIVHHLHKHLSREPRAEESRIKG